MILRRFVNDVLHRGSRSVVPVFSKILVRREPAQRTNRETIVLVTMNL